MNDDNLDRILRTQNPAMRRSGIAPIAVGEIILDPEVRRIRDVFVLLQLSSLTWEPEPMPLDYRPHHTDHARPTDLPRRPR